MRRKEGAAITKLEAQRGRLLRKATDPRKQATPSEPVAGRHMAQSPTLTESCDAIVSGMIQGQTFEEAAKDDGIPTFLRRDLNALPDPRTKEKKAERRAVEKEKREAELTGKRRKMPLSGKEALKAIAQAEEAKSEKTGLDPKRMEELGFRRYKRRG
jgi:hypothetical protein